MGFWRVGSEGSGGGGEGGGGGFLVLYEREKGFRGKMECVRRQWGNYPRRMDGLAMNNGSSHDPQRPNFLQAGWDE